MVVWAYLRHYINLCILYSLLPNGEFKTVGSYELNWETQQYKCWISQIITFCLLAALQLINIFWYVLIMRILYRYLFTGEKKDDRSDHEEEEEEEEREVQEKEQVAKTEYFQVNGNDEKAAAEKAINGHSK